jgi:hypothetical protein
MAITISRCHYQAGIVALKNDFKDKTVMHTNHGETLLWLKKGEA